MNVRIQLNIPTALYSEEKPLRSKDSAARPVNSYVTSWALPANHKGGAVF